MRIYDEWREDQILRSPAAGKLDALVVCCGIFELCEVFIFHSMSYHKEEEN